MAECQVEGVIFSWQYAVVLEDAWKGSKSCRMEKVILVKIEVTNTALQARAHRWFQKLGLGLHAELQFMDHASQGRTMLKAAMVIRLRP